MTEENNTVGRPFGQKLAHPRNMTDQALEALGYNKPHVWHINGEIIAKFKTGLEAYKAFDNTNDEVNYTIDDVWYVAWKSEVGILLEENEMFQPHVHCLDATVIGEFTTYWKAIEAFEAYKNIVTIHTGESQSKVSKSDIVVMSENEFECL